MLPTTPLLLITAALATLAAAHPFEKRNCPTLLPTTIIQLHENDPDTSYPNTGHTNDTALVYQDVDGATGKHPFLSFLALRLIFRRRSQFSSRTKGKGKMSRVVSDEERNADMSNEQDKSPTE